MIDNKEIIKRIRDYADCADASYGYFHCINNQRFVLMSLHKIKGGI